MAKKQQRKTAPAREVFSLVEGGEMMILYPKPLSDKTISEIEEHFALCISKWRKAATR